MVRPRRALDAIALAVAFVYALPTLGYPVSRDHALFFYIGREWLRGGLPYRDAYDFKPPGIFALNALSILVFGEHQWAIRMLELMCIPLMAWLIAFAVQRDGERKDGELGAITLIVAGFYYAAFNYWDTAQTEFFESLALLASYVAAVRVRDVKRAALASGALVGVAVLFKFPAPAVGIVCTGVVAARGYRESAGNRRARVGRAVLCAATHGIAAAAVLLLVIAYFAARGGLPAMIDMLFWHLWDYHAHSTSLPGEAASGIRGYFATGTWPTVVLVAWVAAVIAARRRGARGVVRGAGMAMALFVASVGAVVLQKRYLPYYWGVTVPFVALCAAYAVAECARVSPRTAVAGAVAAALLGLLETPRWPMTYLTAMSRFYTYARGEMPRWDYLESFRGPFDYSYRDEEALGDFIRARAEKGDLLHVRGYEPAVYVVSGLRSPSRFSTEIPLFLPNLSYKRAEWTAENENAIWGARPRFIVTFVFHPEDIEAIGAHGYRETGRQGVLVVMERE